MTVWPNQNVADLNDFYGNPDHIGDGCADPLWEAANLTAIVPPYKMVLAWAPAQSVSRIHIHKKCADSLLNVLRAIYSHYGSQEEVEAARMHLFGGAYSFRLMRGAARLSVHSWGAAIDLDPAHNVFGERYDVTKGMMPGIVYELFAEEGWTWGGRWSKPDAMHFQAANVGA